MLSTETYRLDGELDRLDDRIEDLDDDLADLDESTDEYQAVAARRDRLTYFERGLRWQRDEEDWGDAEIELGAMTAGENAKMHRDSPENADGKEMRLWFVAASTVDAPYAGGDLEATFQGLAGDDIHPAFVEWLEAKANSLGIPAASGNRSSTSSTASSSSGTSTDTSEPDSTT